MARYKSLDVRWMRNQACDVPGNVQANSIQNPTTATSTLVKALAP
jgi:hypothetical protein